MNDVLREFANNIIDKAFINYIQTAGLYSQKEFYDLSVHVANKRQLEYSAGRKSAYETIKMIDSKHSDCIGANEDGSVKWPTGLVGSITHSNGIALSVVGSDLIFDGIGVDIERLLSFSRAVKLVQKICTHEEMISFHDCFNPMIVSILFSAKECLFKALYPITNSRFYFKDAQIIKIDIANNTWTIKLLKSLSNNHIAGNIYNGVFFVGHDFIISLVYIKKN
jgi:enterobactin synthetase component D